jgi:hypothetical protein
MSEVECGWQGAGGNLGGWWPRQLPLARLLSLLSYNSEGVTHGFQTRWVQAWGAILHPWIAPAPDPHRDGFGRGFSFTPAGDPMGA